MLAPNTRLVLSMLPDLATPLLSVFPNKDMFLHVADFLPETAKTTLHAWLHDVGRRVTVEQEELVMDAFSTTPTPLFLRIATDLALTWNSYTPISSITFGQTVCHLYPPSLHLLCLSMSLGAGTGIDHFREVREEARDTAHCSRAVCHNSSAAGHYC